MGRRLLFLSGILGLVAFLGACGPGAPLLEGGPVGAGATDHAQEVAEVVAATLPDDDRPRRGNRASRRTLSVELPLPTARGRFGNLACGLVLRLLQKDGLPGVDMIVRGPAWSAAYGCAAETTVWVDGWGDAARPGLGRILDDALYAVRGNPAQIEVLLVPGSRDEQALRRDVFPLVREVAVAGIGAVHVHPARRICCREGPVERGLRWLAYHQAHDGSWAAATLGRTCGGQVMRTPVDLGAVDARDDVRNTGLALLAFLGAGYTNRGGHPIATTVARGLRHLKNVQRDDGAFDVDLRAHATATVAMTEAYGMTGSPLLRRWVQRALDQLPQAWEAAWRDEVATAWTVLALGSALLINQDAEKRGKPRPLTVDEDFRDHILRRVKDGGASGGPAARALELLGRVLLADERPSKEELRALAEHIPWGTAGLLHRWLGTLSTYQAGGEPWKRWNRLLKTAVLPTQRTGGSPCCLEGSWDPEGGADRLCTTALNILCLEVYYRYDKVYGMR